jgi:predicted nucleic acid-binding Zn ribbon protein
MNGESKKACPFCAETIPMAAKICPRCRQWVSWRSLRNPVVGIIIMLCAMLLVGGCVIFFFTHVFSRVFNPPPYYDEHIGSLQILQSKMFFKDTTNGPRIYITGILTNRSQIAWHDIEFECRFLGTNGSLIDAYTSRSFSTVQANDDGAFRVTVTPVKDFKEYANLKLSISNARNVKSPF